MAAKPKGYKVTGAVAVIRKDGNERYVYRGVTLPASAFDEDNAKHLLNAGLIEAVEVESTGGAAFPDGDPSDSWKNDELKAYAEAKSIDLGGATKKDEILAAIVGQGSASGDQQ